MQLTHDFTVPASPEQTWAALNDIEGVAGCFPGATVTGVEGDAFEGSCKVKLGPIALVYRGAGAFVEKDESARRMKIEAKGKDKRGNGTAGADVLATMEDAGDGQTKVTVLTELTITGKPAQFGRGVMQDVSDKLLAQFVDCLAQKLSGSGDQDADQDAGPASEPAGAAAAEAPAEDQDAGPASEPTAATAPPPTSTVPPQRQAPEQEQESDDALDLGTALMPVLMKNYGKQTLGGLAGLFVLVWLVRRIRR